MSAYTNIRNGKSIQQHTTSLGHGGKKGGDKKSSQVSKRNASMFPKKLEKPKKK